MRHEILTRKITDDSHEVLTASDQNCRRANNDCNLDQIVVKFLSLHDFASCLEDRHILPEYTISMYNNLHILTF